MHNSSQKTDTQTLMEPEYTLGKVGLRVSDLERSLAFYTERIGFKVHQKEGNTAALGVGEGDLLILTEDKSAKSHPYHSGLYHYAIKLPSAYDLAISLAVLAQTRTPLQGLSDHAVSEAIYLADPDNIGIEIMYDRPRSTWQTINGTLNIGTEPLDVDRLMANVEGEIRQEGLPAGTRMGHMHMHVADLEAAEHFYRDVLGFDPVLRFGPYMSFLATGGYHHHIGLRPGRGPLPDDAVGLTFYEINLTGEEALDAMQARLEGADFTVQRDGTSLIIRDPSNYEIRLVGDHPYRA